MHLNVGPIPAGGNFPFLVCSQVVSSLHSQIQPLANHTYEMKRKLTNSNCTGKSLLLKQNSGDNKANTSICMPYTLPQRSNLATNFNLGIVT